MSVTVTSAYGRCVSAKWSGAENQAPFRRRSVWPAVYAALHTRSAGGETKWRELSGDASAPCILSEPSGCGSMCGHNIEARMGCSYRRLLLYARDSWPKKSSLGWAHVAKPPCIWPITSPWSSNSGAPLEPCDEEPMS
eukprot:scaffold283335_cov30-Tisochrysis_lutea.AAC.2